MEKYVSVEITLMNQTVRKCGWEIVHGFGTTIHRWSGFYLKEIDVFVKTNISYFTLDLHVKKYSESRLKLSQTSLK